MNKIWIIFCLCLFVGAPLAAQEYTVVHGERQFADLGNWGAYSGGEMTLGLGVAQSPSGPKGGGDYTKPGAVLGAAALVDMLPFLSSGAEYNYAAFRTPAAVRGTEYTLQTQEVFGLFKFKWNVAKNFRVYAPLGVGGAWLRLTRRQAGEESFRDKWAVAATAGAGVEVDLSPTYFIGAEYRYVLPFIQTADLDPANGSSRYLQMHHFFVRIGKRFF